MINRTMVRTRVIQTLFAYYQAEDSTPAQARKALLRSFTDTYALYIQLFGFAGELIRYAEQQMEESEARARATHTHFMPDRRFINNRLADDLFHHHELRHFTEEYQLSWDAGMNAVSSVYKEMLTTPFWKNYMQLETVTYDDDKHLFRRIYQDLLPRNEEIIPALEEMEVVLDRNHWATDFDVVLSYVIKTLKRFKEHTSSDSLSDQVPLLPMFDKEEELAFGQDLLQAAIEHHDTYMEMINRHLKNWDADRVAYMDRIIMMTALAEILSFPEIALEVSLNEYIEIAKQYSSDKSHTFINGILDQVLKEEKDNHALFKSYK